MNFSSPSRLSLARFGLATVLVRLAVRLCPLSFACRFAEEATEWVEEKADAQTEREVREATAYLMYGDWTKG
jgi:hypothetical protein